MMGVMTGLLVAGLTPNQSVGALAGTILVKPIDKNWILEPYGPGTKVSNTGREY
ncbi:hypothetical protein GCM10008094_35730 [Aidingimonas halophila]|nr:hypothetical protein GCM10008094_35730 [Aidingimonas halophila]